MKPRETRTKARALYVTGRLSLVVIAQELGIDRRTVGRWKSEAKGEGDDWDTARAAAVMAGEGFEKMVQGAVEGFADLFQTTMTQVRDRTEMPVEDRVKLMASLSDAFVKMMGAAGRASPKLSRLAIATEVLQRLADFVRSEFPHHGAAFEELLEPFALRLTKDMAE